MKKILMTMAMSGGETKMMLDTKYSEELDDGVGDDWDPFALCINIPRVIM